METPLVNQDKNHHYKIYGSRWTMLAIFCFLSFSNALMWITFAPISDDSEKYFNMDATAINILALVFQIMYPFGAFFSVVTMKKYGLRNTLLWGGGLTTLGGAIRLISAVVKGHIGDTNSYILYLLGQTLAAIAQPMYNSLPATIAATWFPVNERDIAITVASLFNPLGNAFGQVLPPAFVVSNDDDNASVSGFQDLMFYELLVIALSFALALFLFQSRPPSPPSHSMKMKNMVTTLTYVYPCIYIYTHTYTHKHIYIYIVIHL